MINVLITGADGFIGRATVKVLCHDKRYHIHAMDLDFEKCTIASNISYVRADLMRGVPKGAFSSGIDIILHLAGTTDNQTAYRNVVMAEKVLDYCRQNHVRKIIFASTFQVYGGNARLNVTENENCMPISPYAVSKLECERLLCDYFEQRPTGCHILRYFNVYGKDTKKGLFGILSESLSTNVLKLRNDGHDIRDFVYINDVVNANVLSVQAVWDESFNIFNIGSGRGYEVCEIVKAFTNDREVFVLYGNKEDPIRTVSANILKAKDMLSYRPRTSLQDGIKILLEEF